MWTAPWTPLIGLRRRPAIWTAGHRHGRANRRRARADDQPLHASVNDCKRHADAVGNRPDGGKIRGQRFDRCRPVAPILLTGQRYPTYVQLVNSLVDQECGRDGR